MGISFESRRPGVGWVLLVPVMTAAVVGCAPQMLPSPAEAPLDRAVPLQTAAAEERTDVAKETRSESTPEPIPVAAADLAGNEPEEWRNGNEYTLRVQKSRIALPGAAQDGGPQEVELLTYNGRPVGPTIRVRRGSTLEIHVINELPTQGAPPLMVDPMQEEKPHDLYTTNLHTHGLHVSPSGNSDNVFREIAPLQSFTYTFTIPRDHPAGTFWYHPHKHGSVAYQMANGMAGALIVEGRDPSGTVRDLDSIPEIARAREQIFVLQQLILRRDEDGLGRVDPNDVYTETPSPRAYQATTVNGVVLPTYSMHPKEVQRWRFIHAGREEPIVLQWRNAKNWPVRTMPFYEIALDGLATGAMKPKRRVQLFPGNRSDVLVKAPAEPGTYYLATELEQEDQPAAAAAANTVKFLAKLIVHGAEQDMRLPSNAQLASCKPFTAIEPAECTVKRDLVFQYDDRKKIFHINGVPFSKQSSLEKPVLGTAEEWTLSAENEPSSTSPDEPHPFHIHVNPFQVVQIEDIASKKVTKVNEWRDTVVVEKGTKLTIRLRFRDFAGKTVLHCHAVDHEDQGMMRTIQIVDPKQPGDAGEDSVAQLIECSFPAPPLMLPTMQQSACDLCKLRPRNIVLVFFRGMGCVHCAQQLRSLLRDADERVLAETTIVAVSSEPIADPEQVRQWLDVSPQVQFQLLVDTDRRGFRTFGCYSDGPRHGLFVIDSTGTVRAKYVGDVPFSDARAVWARVGRSRNIPLGPLEND
ncbi:MAG TPA: multicopper oxidase domain-containing protein [Gemmataceae bacterium]|nr:multicopper oxidase domain-containing protein [Gemmataceae bacterium]